MPIIQFLSGFAVSLFAAWVGGQFMKRALITRWAAYIDMKLADAIKAQNIGGDADEHLRLEGEIRAYRNFLK